MPRKPLPSRTSNESMSLVPTAAPASATAPALGASVKEPVALAATLAVVPIIQGQRSSLDSNSSPSAAAAGVGSMSASVQAAAEPALEPVPAAELAPSALALERVVSPDASAVPEPAPLARASALGLAEPNASAVSPFPLRRPIPRLGSDELTIQIALDEIKNIQSESDPTPIQRKLTQDLQTFIGGALSSRIDQDGLKRQWNTMIEYVKTLSPSQGKFIAENILSRIRRVFVLFSLARAREPRAGGSKSKGGIRKTKKKTTSVKTKPTRKYKKRTTPLKKKATKK